MSRVKLYLLAASLLPALAVATGVFHPDAVSAQTLLPLLSGDVSSAANGIDAAGDIAGKSVAPTGVGSTGPKAVLWTGATYTITTIPNVGTYKSQEANSVVNISSTPKTTGALIKSGASSPSNFRVFFYNGSTSIDINVTSGAGYGSNDAIFPSLLHEGTVNGSAINGTGWSVGTTTVSRTYDQAWVYRPSPTNVLTHLPPMFPSTPYYPVDRAYGISDLGHIVGQSADTESSPVPSVWQYNGTTWNTPFALPLASGCTSGVATAISAGTTLDNSVIVGECYESTSIYPGPRPVYWKKEAGAWTVHILPFDAGHPNGVALCVTDDGDVIGGTVLFSPSSNQTAATWRRSAPGSAYAASGIADGTNYRYLEVRGVRSVGGVVKGVGVTDSPVGFPTRAFIYNVP